jgi:hypothetical protein
MYKINFVCTYKAFETLEDDEVNSDMLYQAQFLQVFGITEYNSDAINASLELIKTKANQVPELHALIMQHPYGQCNRENESVDVRDTQHIDMMLPLMFSYPLLDVFHLCLIDAFNSGKITKEHVDGVLQEYAKLI